MGRQKSTPNKLNNPGEHWDLHKPLDYIPIKKRKNRKKNSASGQTYNIVVPSEKNKQFYVGELCIGSTNNEVPEQWKSCKMSFLASNNSQNEHLLINLDDTTVIVELLPENDVKEIVVSKIFAINVRINNATAYFDLYFCDLPLPKFTKRLGACIQTVLSVLLGAPIHSDEDEDEVDQSNNQVITQLYSNIKKIREQQINLGCDTVQHPRLKPKLRPYQADAVRWMILREKESCDEGDKLHPLYTKITLKSGLEVYYDTYSGYVDVTKPVVVPSSRGGILADEMGLGKTVEVLACILSHPKLIEISDENSSDDSDDDLEKSPTVKLITRKRKIREPAAPVSKVEPPKKLKVPEAWVKPSSKKSETFIALELWYQKILGSVNKKSTYKPEENTIQCVCGGSDEAGSVSCEDCGKMQHGSCLGFEKNFGPYRCPQCWTNQPLIEIKGTLIVTPVSLRTQWCKEICKHVRGGFKVLQYGGSSVTPVYPTALEKYDVVITTYNVLQSELRLTDNETPLSFRYQRRYSPPGSPLTRVKWWRLCLDEAQTVETPTSMVSEMAKKLNAHFRWAVTGTPISKEISDLHGLIDYLQMEPYNDKFTWEQLLFNPYFHGRPEPMLNFLSQVLWRSSKDEIIDQINIPKQTVQEHFLSFSAIEHYFYRCEHQSNCEAFLDKVRHYDANVPLHSLEKGSLKTVLAPLLSLRQVCTYPNSVRTRYLATKKPVKSMKDLLDALIAKNTNESEEFLRKVLSALNGLAGIYLLLQSPEQAIEEYRKVLQHYTRFTEEKKVAKLTVDKLQVIHTMHNLAEILGIFPNVADKTLRDETLRKDCADLEQKYIGKFITQSMAALQDSLLISANIQKLQDSFVLAAGQWYGDLLNWMYIHGYEQDLYSRVENLHSVANVECTVDVRNARSLIYAIGIWDEKISQLRESTIEVVNDLYTHCPEDEFQIIVDQELVQHATDCHLRPQKKSKSKKKCPLCVANDHLKSYEFKLFSMSKRTSNFEDMSLKGSWKPTSEELIFKAILSIGRAKNADNELVKDGEAHINIVETMKKEFKEVRKLWTHLDQQICAQDELDMCKIRLRLKETNDENQAKKTTPAILKNLTYSLENKLETIHVLDEHELEYQRKMLHIEDERNMALLEKNLGTRSYLETLYEQQHDDQKPDPCPICKNAMEQHWSIVPCGHSYCLDCLQLLIDQTKGHHMQCSVCRAYHLVTEISYIKNGEQNAAPEGTKIVGNYSTKVESIVKLILQLKTDESDVKVLVFSSWTPVLSYLREALMNNDVLTELGSFNLEKQIERFKDPKQNITALLLPIHLGSKGLNLIEATHVILTEPLLNPGDELQAIGRVHRIGQTRPTVVHKFCIRDTIEDSIQKAVSTDVQNWDKNKVTIRQLMDLFVKDGPSAVATQAEPSN